MSNEIVLISETDIDQELKLAQEQINSVGYSFTFPVTFSKVIHFLKVNSSNIVIINAKDKKLEAYELCQEIKNQFRGAIKVYVFLPEAKANEASKFGLASAEVEDADSIALLSQKLPSKEGRDFVIQENTISMLGLNGGVGTTSLTLNLAGVCNHYRQDLLLLESSGSLDIKNILGLNTNLALINRDQHREVNQAKDLDWFKNFLARSQRFQSVHYLNLLKTSLDKDKYLTEMSKYLESLNAEMQDLVNLRNYNDLKFNSISNSLKLLTNDLKGHSYTLFDELISLGSKLSSNMLFDLGTDFTSPINRQLLRISKYVVVLFRDSVNVREEYIALKEFLEYEYKVEVIPVLAANHHNYQKYSRLAEDRWIEVLGQVPMVYPYEPEELYRFLWQGEALRDKSKLFGFALDLINRTDTQLGRDLPETRSGLMKFLMKSHA